MKISELVKAWEADATERLTAREYAVRMPLDVAAKIRALAEMYPARTEARIITDLLDAALRELEVSFPYVKGTRVIAEDEFGDEIFEDLGLTPRFHELTQKYVRLLAADARARARSGESET